jgi:glycosyltransferase involved in cell wall biosynthesis
MRIVLDFRPALHQGTGVGTYVHNLAMALCEGFPDDTYTLFSASWKHRVNGSRTPAGAQVADWKIPVAALDWSWHRWRWPAVERFAGDADIAHSPSPMLLPSRRARAVVTVHDCHFLRHPEDVFGPVRRDYVPLARQAASRADAVLTVSETTAADVEELLAVPRARIRVTPLGVDRAWFGAAPESAAPLLQRHAVDRPFLLFVGRRERRKDLGALLAAFDLLLAAGEDLQLVLAGTDAPGWEQTWDAATPRVRGGTRLMPHQDAACLAGLYAAAAVLAMPSRWEGFGLTGLEAMACGTPVVASRVGSLPEVLGDAALFAAPGDAAAMAEQCRRLLHDSELARRMSAAGRVRAAGFRWTETARRTHALYRELAG